MWIISQALMMDYENSRSSQVRAAESWGENCSDGEQSAPSNTNHTQQVYLSHDRTTEAFRRFQSLMTSETLTEDRGEDLLTWYREDFHARISAWPEKAQELTANAQGFGRKCTASLAKYDPDSRTWKTAQQSFIADWDGCLETWPTAGMTAGMEYYQQPPLEQSINVTDGGALPNGETFFHTPNTTGLDGGSNSRKALKKRQSEFATPTTMDSLPPKSEQELLREMTVARPGRSKPANLRDQVSNMDNWKMWPTPSSQEPGVSYKRLVDKDGNVPTHTNQSLYDKHTGRLVQKGLNQAVHLWPTPQTSDFDAVAKFPMPCATMSKGSSPAALTKKDGKDRTNDRLDHFVGDTVTARLNPDWVESYLMLWPRGWTALKPLSDDAWYSMQPHDEPEDLPRVTANCPNRATRLKAIGNGQVPLCAATAWSLLVLQWLVRE
jgi:hypothetical protein